MMINDDTLLYAIANIGDLYRLYTLRKHSISSGFKSILNIAELEALICTLSEQLVFYVC